MRPQVLNHFRAGADRQSASSQTRLEFLDVVAFDGLKPHRLQVFGHVQPNRLGIQFPTARREVRVEARTKLRAIL